MSELPPGEYVSVGGDVDEIRVSLRITGDDLNPDEITGLLGVEPTHAHRKGETFGNGRGVRRSGMWSLAIGESREWLLVDAITVILDRLPDNPAVWIDLSGRYGLDLFCGLFLREWNRGVSLPATIIRRIAERGLALNLDIYGHIPADDE